MDKDTYIHTYTHKDTYMYIYVCKDTYIHCDNTYNGILSSHKKKKIWVNCSEKDKPIAYYTEGIINKLEREQQIY